MRLITKSITAALIAGAFSASWAANTIAPQNGNWVIADEMTGKPGRGMGIDVQDGIFVMQVYNYNKDGSPTFHMVSGKVEDNKVDAPLKQYKNGPFFGSKGKDGVEAADAGNVKVEFTSRTTATIQFPGEEAKTMHRFDYEGVAEDEWSDKAYVERWAIVKMDKDNKPTGTAWADIGVGSHLAMSTDMHAGWPYSDSAKFAVHLHDLATPKVYSFLECDYSGANHVFTCAGEQIDSSKSTLVRTPITMSLIRSIDQLQGTVTINDEDALPLLGARVEKTSYQIQDNKLVTKEYFRRNSLPEAGTWIVSSEITGKAGRGISLDVQKVASAKHTLFMPIYNYERDGKATFHLALGTHSPSVKPTPDTPRVELNRYSDGRYFGGSAKDGKFDQYVGMADISFDTNFTGKIQFPDEEAVVIQRFYFGVDTGRIDSLVGTWAVIPHGGALRTRILNLKKTDSGVVEDKEAGYSCFMNYWMTYRVLCEPKNLSYDHPRLRISTGYYGAARGIMGDGGPLLDSTPEFTIMRISDGSGNLIQGGPMYPAPVVAPQALQ